ncbi:hypothetical protein Tco_0824774 [Tanacetum coccineum]|uniref:Uncharacterized protein n=1 Tax=Tanacetum coccineum TaxID=301880 RepID=A0ABQ5ALP9_9ASTR
MWILLILLQGTRMTINWTVWNQRAVNDCWQRETVGSTSMQHSGIQCFTAGDLSNLTGKQHGRRDDEQDGKHITSYMQRYRSSPNAELRTDSEPVGTAWVKHSKDLLYLRNPTAQDMEILVKTCLMPLALKTKNDSFAFVHELKQEMHADLKYVESLEDELDELESDKAEFSNMECDCLAQKLSEQTEFFAKKRRQMYFERNVSNIFENTTLKAQLQDKNIAISELKKLIEKCKEKSVDTKFDKPFVVRQPNAQRIPKPSVLGKPTPFSNSPEVRSFQTKQSVNKTNVSDGSSNQVTLQNLPLNRKQAEIHSNERKPGMHRFATSTKQNREPQLPHASRNTNPYVSKSTGVTHPTSVSRPQLKSYQVKDKVVPNISQVKFTKKEVEDHHRISSISKNNESSNSRTSNVNAVCAECGKCVFNSNHDACVSRYLNDVNARTKKPKVVPISASKLKRKANKSVATPHKKTVASDNTIQKPKSYFKELYENTNKAWEMGIAKRNFIGIHMTHKRHLLDLVLNGNQRVESLVMFVLGGFPQESYSTLARARLKVNPHMVQM